MEAYKSKLTKLETQQAIQYLRHTFEEQLCCGLNLTRASAPLFVTKNSGLNDDLNGVERAVGFDVRETGEICEVVHSLAKWKRYALYKYEFPMHMGLYTDMNAIRRDEECNEFHSIYVDQWDWEKVISKEDRNENYLTGTVNAIYGAILETVRKIECRYPQIHHELPEKITFVTTQQLEDAYPELTPKQREDAAAKKYKAIFLMQIGGKLRSGKKHDGRAPDYDDWNLNGDIILYSPIHDKAFEISSMGIRVDENSLVSQLKEENAENRLNFEFHKLLVNKVLPYTIGGGIGQSRLCMYILQKKHIGEVQSSVWPKSELDRCKKESIELL